MTEPFIPFVPAKAPIQRVSSGASPELKVVPEPSAASPFQSISPAAMAGHTHGVPRKGAEAQPKITLQRDGEKVIGIRVECTCGQVIEMACSY